MHSTGSISRAYVLRRSSASSHESAAGSSPAAGAATPSSATSIPSSVSHSSAQLVDMHSQPHSHIRTCTVAHTHVHTVGHSRTYTDIVRLSEAATSGDYDAGTHARTHARTQSRTHAHTHAHARTHHIRRKTVARSGRVLRLRGKSTGTGQDG